MDENISNQLTILYNIQKIDTNLGGIVELRGNLPEEVDKLSQELKALALQIEKQQALLVKLEQDIVGKKQEAKQLEAKIQQYESQQMEVQNDREYSSIMQELEYHTLEKQLADKFIRTTYQKLECEQASLKDNESLYKTKEEGFLMKTTELEEILKATQAEEKDLYDQREALVALLDAVLYKTYEKIRNNFPNNLAVVPLIKGACGGCCIVVPSYQRLLVYERNKIVFCDYCGRMIIVPEHETNDVHSVMNM